MSSNLSSLEATNAVKTEIRLKFKATPAPWGSGSGSDLVEGSLSGSPSIEFDPCSYPGSDSDSGQIQLLAQAQSLAQVRILAQALASDRCLVARLAQAGWRFRGS